MFYVKNKIFPGGELPSISRQIYIQLLNVTFNIIKYKLIEQVYEGEEAGGDRWRIDLFTLVHNSRRHEPGCKREREREREREGVPHYIGSPRSVGRC